MLSRLHTSLFSSLILLGAACGDSGNTSATETTSSTTDTPTSTEPTTSTTTDETPTSTTTTSETSTTTEDNPTTEPATSTTTGVTPGDCEAPADDADEDGDTIANKDDNCRCDPNPNQLDFDGNSVGNVCDAPLSFTIADGAPPEFNKLDSQASAAMGPIGCNFPVSLIGTGGDIQVTLDDEGQAKLFAVRLNFADTQELTCEIPVLLTVKLRIEQLVISGVDPFTVGFPFTVADHNAGMLSGLMDMVHNILVNGVINVTESSNEGLAMPGESPLEDVPGSFPAGQVTVLEADGQITVDFASDDHIVFKQTTMGGLEITLTGLTGKIRLRQ